jgi:uncharacterized ParB-like nuclease family protein
VGHLDGLEEIPVRNVTEVEVEQARRTVCSYATDAEDAAELLEMLGLAPTSAPVESAPVRVAAVVGNQGQCVKCGVRTEGKAYGALGQCQRCYMQTRRARKEAE